MRAIFFPFTCITEKTIDVMGGYLRPIVIYQPSRLLPFKGATKWISDRFIELRCPLSGDEAMLETILKDFRGWGELHHQGIDLKAAYAKAGSDTVPFFYEDSVSKIRSDIKIHAQHPKPNPERDRLSIARVFLHMAQEYDSRIQEVNDDMELLEVMQRRFKKELQGVLSDATPKGKEGMEGLKEDPGSYMTAERLDAWTALFLSDEMHHAGDASGMLVTNSRSVWLELVDSVAGPREIIRLERMPSLWKGNAAAQEWRHRFDLYLETLIKEKGPVAAMAPAQRLDSGDGGTLTILRVLNTDVFEFFAQFLKQRPQRHETPPRSVWAQNLLIGLIEI